MKLDDTRVEFSIYLNEMDRYKGKRLYYAILEKLYDIGVTGATVIPALVAYGGEFEIKRRSWIPWRKNRSLVIKVIERRQLKEKILQLLDEMMQGGVITTHEVDFTRYTPTVITKEDQEIAKTAGSNLPSSLLDDIDK